MISLKIWITPLLMAVVLDTRRVIGCEVIPGFTNRVLPLNGTRLDGLITIYAKLNPPLNVGPSDVIEFLGPDDKNQILYLKADMWDGAQFEVRRALKPANDPGASYSTLKKQYDFFKASNYRISPNNKDVILQIRSYDDGTWDLYLLGFEDPGFFKFNSEWDDQGFATQPISETTRIRHMSHDDGAAPVDILFEKITVCKDSRPSLQNEERLEVKPGEEVSLSCNGTGPSHLIVDWVDQHGTYLNGQTEYLDAPDGFDRVKSVLKVTVPEATESERTINTYHYKCMIRNIVDKKGTGTLKRFLIEPKLEDEPSTSSSHQPDDLDPDIPTSFLKNVLMSTLIPLCVVGVIGFILYIIGWRPRLPIFGNVQRDDAASPLAVRYKKISTNPNAEIADSGSGTSDGLRKRQGDKVISSCPTTEQERKKAVEATKDNPLLREDERDPQKILQW